MWAQDKNRVFLTLDGPSIDNPKVELMADGTLKYSAMKDNVHYLLENQLFGEVDVENSKWNTKGRNTIVNVAKKEAGGEYWPRLTKSDKKDQTIKVAKHTNIYIYIY